MNNKDRKIFWDTLCSLQGIDINHEAEILRKTIKMPKYLYRFRPVSINIDSALFRLTHSKVFGQTQCTSLPLTIMMIPLIPTLL